jgi:hypothetical protein
MATSAIRCWTAWEHHSPYSGMMHRFLHIEKSYSSEPVRDLTGHVTDPSKATLALLSLSSLYSPVALTFPNRNNQPCRAIKEYTLLDCAVSFHEFANSRNNL